MSDIYQLYPRFQALFDGLQDAFGTGEGRWVKRAPKNTDWLRHLQGQGPGIGIAPLRPDNTVMFAAIDLDEPDFDAASDMQDFVAFGGSGTAFVERSRSGNAHVWVFFAEPIEAWIVMGILKEATLAAGKEHVEVFPKNYDFGRVRLGNYINLPYHGDQRKVVWHLGHTDQYDLSLEQFIDLAEASKYDPAAWRKRADWLQINDPFQASHTGPRATFGDQNHLHICAEHIIGTAHENPIREGHRSVVFFNLAKQLSNWKMVDYGEALEMMRSVNGESPDPLPDSEIRRVLTGAYERQYTSTGCDDPLFAPYAHPDCPIAHPRS